MIKNVVFDMGNVILRWDPQYIAEKLSNNEKEKEIIINGSYEYSIILFFFSLLQ